MKRPQPPRRGTPAFIALSRVLALGGVATTKQLMTATQSQFASVARLDRMVIRPLIDIGFVVSVKEGVRITPAGREYIGSDAAPTSKGYANAASAPLQAAEAKPLSASKHLRLEERRPGSLDYRDMPSLIGDERVPFSVGSLGGREGGAS